MALEPTNAQPLLSLIDTVVLYPDSLLPVGMLGSYLAAAADGEVLVADRTHDVVIAFARGGRERRRFGRRGDGPGELNGVSTVLAADSLVLVEGYRSRRVTAFHRQSGLPLGYVKYGGDVERMLLIRDTVYLATRGTPDSTVLAALAVPSLSRSAVSAASPIPLKRPTAYFTYPQLVLFEGAAMDQWRDTLAMAFGGLNLVRVTDRRTRASTDVEVPARLRAGSKPDSLARYFVDPASRLADQYRTVSDVRLLQRLSTGRVMLVHADLRLEDPGNGRSPSIETGYVSVIDLTSRQACVDARLDVPGSETVRVTAEGDTLLVVDQVVGGSAAQPEVVLVLRRYRVDDSQCGFRE